MLGEMYIGDRRRYDALYIWRMGKRKDSYFNQEFYGLANKHREFIKKTTEEYFLRTSKGKPNYMVDINGFSILLEHFRYLQNTSPKQFDELEKEYRVALDAEKRVQLQNIESNLHYEDNIAYIKVAYIRGYVKNLDYLMSLAKEDGNIITIKKFNITTHNAKAEYTKSVQFIEYIHLLKIAKYAPAPKKHKLTEIVGQIRSSLRGKHVVNASDHILSVIKEHSKEIFGVDIDELHVENENLRREIIELQSHNKKLLTRLEKYVKISKEIQQIEEE